MPKGRWCCFSRAMAWVTLSYTPSPRRESLASSKPSRLMAGIKLPTRSMSWQNSSSIRVALVKERKAASLCFSHRAIRSFLRTSGSPPV